MIFLLHAQDNFAARVTALTELVRAAHFRKRQDAIDRQLQFA